MPDRIRLDGKVAVVTGAAGVIGSATMRLLAERGARIVAVDRKKAELKTAIKELPAAADPLLVTADVTREEEVAEYVHAALDKFGTIDVFFNNAGIEGEVKSIPDYPLESFRKVLDVNVVGVFLGMKHVLPGMLKNKKGSIINTASIAGLVGSPQIAVYSASKHAVIGLTKSAAWECTGTGVREADETEVPGGPASLPQPRRLMHPHAFSRSLRSRMRSRRLFGRMSVHTSSMCARQRALGPLNPVGCQPAGGLRRCGQMEYRSSSLMTTA